jgi:hypothetical protein
VLTDLVERELPEQRRPAEGIVADRLEDLDQRRRRALREPAPSEATSLTLMNPGRSGGGSRSGSRAEMEGAEDPIASADDAGGAIG